MEAKARLAVEEIEAGKLVDVQLLEARPGYRYYMRRYVRQRAMEQDQNVRDALANFEYRLQNQMGSTAERARQQQIVKGAEAMVKQVENLSNVMANGPHQWLTAPTQRTAPRNWPFYILPEVNGFARSLSDDWHNIYRETWQHINALWREEGLLASPITDDKVMRKAEIQDLWTKRAWNKIDSLVREAEEAALELPGYKRGMLAASLKQHESIKRANRTIPLEHTDSIILDQMGSRIMKEFSHEEKMGYFQTGRRQIHPTIVMEYEGTPWLVKRERTGRVVDTRRAGVRPSRVRYQRHEQRIGPFTRLKNPQIAEFMELVSALGGEFVYRGDAAHRRGYGVWSVEWRSRIFDPVSGKYMPKTREKIKRWLYDRFIVKAPIDAIPDMYTDPDALQQLVYQTQTVTGRQAIVDPDYIRYQEFAFPEGRIRTEFPNEPYTVEIPSGLSRRVPAQQVPPMNEPALSMDGSPPVDGIQDPLLDLVDEVEVRNPIPARQGEDRQLALTLDELAKMEKQAGVYAVHSIQRQAAQGNTGYKPPVLGAPYPHKSAPVPVGRLGGRDDAAVLLRMLVAEMRVTIKTFAPNEITQARRAAHRRAGMTDFVDPDTGAPLFYLDEVWYSPTLGNYTSVRDVTRAYQDFGNWAGGKRFWYSPAGIQHAKNGDEAMAVIAKELYMRAEHRLIERETKGFWYRMGDAVYHSRDKTHEVGQRVTGKMAMRALSMGGGFYGLYPEARFWTNRRFGPEKAIMNYMREMELPVFFDGDPVAMSRASRSAFDAEVARMSSLVADDVMKVAMINVIAKDMRGVNLFGQDFSPGVIQSISELNDIRKDASEAATAIFKHLDKAIDNNVEIAGKIWLRNGFENTMEGLGYRQIDPSKPLLHGDITPEPDIPERLKKSHVAHDLAIWNRVCKNVRDRMNAGDFVGAGLAGAELLNLRAVQWIRRHNAVYTYFSPHDPRSPGSLMPIIRGTGLAEPIYGLMNVDSGVQSRAWNNSWMQLKQGFKRTIEQAAQKVLGENYYKARREMQNMEEGLRKQTGVRLSITRQMWADNPMYNPRARVGATVLIVHRIRWYRGLSEGFGAKVLSKQLENRDVPVRKRWILDKPPSCQNCIRNARVGWIMNNQEFPTGHQQPPAHPGCDCKLRLSVDDRSNIGKVIKPLTQPRFLNVNRSQRRRLNLNPMRERIPRVMRDVKIPAPPAVIPDLKI